MDNLNILIGLIGIVLALAVGFCIGNRSGIKEGREELERELRHRVSRGVNVRF